MSVYRKLWVDDIREPPGEEWMWLTSSLGATTALRIAKNKGITLEAMSLDHDLGGDDTTRPIVLWMCEHDFWPKKVFVHSANPVGREWLEGMIERYKP